MERVRCSLNVNGKHGSIKFSGTDLSDVRILLNFHDKTPYVPMNQIGEHIGIKFAGTRLDYVNYDINPMVAR